MSAEPAEARREHQIALELELQTDESSLKSVLGLELEFLGRATVLLPPEPSLLSLWRFFKFMRVS